MKSLITTSASELDALFTENVLSGGKIERVGIYNVPALADRFCHSFGFHGFPREGKPLLEELGIRFDNNAMLGAPIFWSRSREVVSLPDRFVINIRGGSGLPAKASRPSGLPEAIRIQKLILLALERP